jgi:hypothetical protein
MNANLINSLTHSSIYWQRPKFASMIFRLTEHLLFPDPELAEEDGLLAVGGDLSTERLC